MIKNVETPSCWIFQYIHHAVDGSEIRRSPPGMCKTLHIMPYLPYQLVQDFFHQQYIRQTSYCDRDLPPIKHAQKTRFSAKLNQGRQIWIHTYGFRKQINNMSSQDDTLNHANIIYVTYLYIPPALGCLIHSIEWHQTAPNFVPAFVASAHWSPNGTNVRLRVESSRSTGSSHCSWNAIKPHPKRRRKP